MRTPKILFITSLLSLVILQWALAEDHRAQRICLGEVSSDCYLLRERGANEWTFARIYKERLSNERILDASEHRKLSESLKKFVENKARGGIASCPWSLTLEDYAGGNIQAAEIRCLSKTETTQIDKCLQEFLGKKRK